MYDRIVLEKKYNYYDPLRNVNLEVCLFHGEIEKGFRITNNIDIHYPTIYQSNIEDISKAYKDFVEDLMTFALKMDIVSKTEGMTEGSENKMNLDDAIKDSVKQALDSILPTLGNITINPVPGYDMNMNNLNY